MAEPVNYLTPIYRLQLVREGSIRSRPQICSPEAAKRFMTRVMLKHSEPREIFVVAPLDTKHRPLHTSVTTAGTRNACLVDVTTVFRSAILDGAAAIIVAHNHPSGDPTPSTEDYTITRQLRDAGKLLGIPLLDHIIVGEDVAFSFLEGTDILG